MSVRSALETPLKPPPSLWCAHHERCRKEQTGHCHRRWARRHVCRHHAASNGFQVTILEKNAQVGGKLNQLQTKGFSFDLGPSIFTLPEIFRPIFEGDGKRLEDYITLQRVDPQWRNFFEDGVIVDLWEDPERMRTELERLGPQVFGEYKDLLAYSRRQYEILERGYLRHGLDTLLQFFRFYGWKEARDLDYLHSMSGSIYKRLSNRYLRDIFEYFIKYVGSSALDSPAFMNLMPTIQMDAGVLQIAPSTPGVFLP
jgi:diapolycopene oxygenase